mmetsp:Transcript_39338/g.80655  ORF Transcript_39338/g.80655 Transcript_39338/m.80655 type:complete len:613 (+) Transcript_39338:194-2032(+)
MSVSQSVSRVSQSRPRAFFHGLAQLPCLSYCDYSTLPSLNATMRRPLTIAAAAAAALCSSLPTAVAFQPAHSAPTTHFRSATATHTHPPAPHPLRRQIDTSATSLSALPAALASLTSPLGSVSVLAFVVLIHEAGHFLAARSMGIKVEEFAVGVGPKLAGFTRKADEDDDEIEFSLRAIPLGGYVRFPENYNTTLAMINEDEARKQRIDYRKAKRAEVVAGSGVGGVAGESPRTSGLLSAISFGLIGRKEREEAERIVKEEAERLEKEQQKRTWKNIFGLVPDKFGLAPVDNAEGSIKRPAPPPEIEYYDDPNLLQNRPWTERAIVLSGGVIFNILLAWACYFGEVTVGGGLPQPVFREGAVITQSPRIDGASNGILHKGDVIVGVNGKPLMATRSPTVTQSQEAINGFISTIRATSPGESLSVSIVKAADDGSKGPVNVVLKPQLNADKSQSIGVMLSPNYVRTDKVQAESITDAFAKASKATSDITGSTARSLLALLGNVVMGKGTGSQAVSGPIGLLKQGSDVVSTAASGRDISAVVGFAAAISVNLAVVNSLPLPALDGGQLAFVLAEGIAGKKIDQKRQEEINATALFLLLAFSLSTAVGDVGRLVK